VKTFPVISVNQKQVYFGRNLQIDVLSIYEALLPRMRLNIFFYMRLNIFFFH